jgi:monoamine oxidase
MARTPLLTALQRSLRMARWSLQTGRAPAEAWEREDERAAARRVAGPRDIGPRDISRRDFLAAGGAAAVTMSLRGVARAAAPARGRGRVIVIGAGIAGLTCAYRLREAGIGVRVFEAQNRVGGRVSSLRGHFDDGQVAELGGELIDSGHAHLHGLARELGLPIDDLAPNGSDERAVWFFGGAKRTEEEVVEAFLPVAVRITAARARMGPDDVTYRSVGAAQELDRQSIAEWLDRIGVSGWFRELLDVAFTTEFGQEIDRQSALNFLTTIDPVAQPFRLYGESDERFHVRGGNDLVPKTLAGRLDGAIEMNCVLERIRSRSDGLLECAFRRGGRTFAAAADHVVDTMPFTLLRAVTIEADLPPAQRRAIAELGYGTNAKLMIGFKARTWRTRYASGGSTLADLPYQLTWETSRLQGGDSGILTNFTGGRHGVELGEGAATDRAAEVAGQLDLVYPGLAVLRTKEARFHWPSFPYTRGSYACYLPGQWTSMRGVEQEPAGNLHFAGEHCSLPAQGFMEGGCETGERAAVGVMAALGLPARAALRARPRVALPS